jgi:hypothetical protein
MVLYRADESVCSHRLDRPVQGGQPMRTITPDERNRRLRSKNRALLWVLLGLAALMFSVAYVRMSEVEVRRHRTLPEAHLPLSLSSQSGNDKASRRP